MTAQATMSDAFTFVGGLNTEGGFFVTPENTFKEGVNVVPKLDGSIERRNGIDYESIYQLFSANISSDNKNLWAFTVGTWSTVAGNGGVNFFVVQAGPTLYFYSAASGNVSGTKKSFTVNIQDYLAFGNTEVAGTAVCSFASTYGRLIVTNQNIDPIQIEYNTDSDTITVKKIDIKIRDFKGKPLIDNAGNPVPVDAEYTAGGWASLGVNVQDVIYNLNNQGWNEAQITTYRNANSQRYPSNTKSWFFGKDPSNDVFSAAFLNRQEFGNSPAPKGKFIISPFEGVAYRPSSCAFFAGRAWFAGIKSDKLLGTVFFSRVLDDFIKVNQCHQTNDPTAEVIADLLDDDGGTIEIPEAGEIVSLQPLGRGIMVLATNGVWFVSGIDQGFTASSYSVERISSVGCLNAKSVVVVEDSILFWSNSGIYAIAASNSLEYAVTNISDAGIKTFYQNIPVLGRLFAEGAYNVSDKTVYWLYADNLSNTSSSGRYNKNYVLAFDIQLSAWYYFTLPESVGPIPVSIETTRETNETIETYGVINGADNVLVGSDEVIVDIETLQGTTTLYKILTLHPETNSITEEVTYSLTFSDFVNTRTTATKFRDWHSFNGLGIEEQAFFVTGYNMGGVGPARAKTGQYLTVFMKRTETSFDTNTQPVNPSGCLLQLRWDFTDNPFPGKWGQEVQVYRQPRPFLAFPSQDFDDGYPLVISKNKMLGRGKAVQFKYTAEAGKDMKIVGWTGTFVGNTNV